MDRRTTVSLALAAAGLVAVVVGVHQELLQFRPMYDATVETGWGGSLNHEERLLARVAVVGLLGVVASLRWRLAAIGSLAAGLVVSFYAARAVAHHAAEGALYTGLPIAGGATGRLLLGTEPYWLLLGGACLVVAGVVRLRTGRTAQSDPGDSVGVTVN
jgi:hypothetical protein